MTKILKLTFGIFVFILGIHASASINSCDRTTEALKTQYNVKYEPKLDKFNQEVQWRRKKGEGLISLVNRVKERIPLELKAQITDLFSANCLSQAQISLQDHNFDYFPAQFNFPDGSVDMNQKQFCTTKINNVKQALATLQKSPALQELITHQFLTEDKSGQKIMESFDFSSISDISLPSLSLISGHFVTKDVSNKTEDMGKAFEVDFRWNFSLLRLASEKPISLEETDFLKPKEYSWWNNHSGGVLVEPVGYLLQPQTLVEFLKARLPEECRNKAHQLSNL